MFEPLLAAGAIALLSLTGVLVFGNQTRIVGTHRFIIPVALGVFLGVVFLELIPETLHSNEQWGGIMIVGGFLAFYLLSHFLRHYHTHAHDHESNTHSTNPESKAHLILIADGIHNVADGVVIVTAFAIDPTLGIATTIGIALHEIPQEIAEFGILVAAGYSKTQAACLNLLSASSVILGAVLAMILMEAGDYLWILTGIAAGNLLYIAASDMIPELHGDAHRSHFKQTFVSTLIGFAVIATLITWIHGEHGHGAHGHDAHGHDEAAHETTHKMIEHTPIENVPALSEPSVVAEPAANLPVDAHHDILEHHDHHHDADVHHHDHHFEDSLLHHDHHHDGELHHHDH